jgi:hypothetical protein
MVYTVKWVRSIRVAASGSAGGDTSNPCRVLKSERKVGFRN